MNPTDSSPQTDPERPAAQAQSTKPPRTKASNYLSAFFLALLVVAIGWWIRSSKPASRKEAAPGPATRPARPPETVRKAENQYQLGLLAAQQNRTDQAMLHFLEAVGLHPDHPQAHGALGSLLQQQGRYTEAAEHLQRDLQINPDNPRSHYFLGLCYSKQEELAEAIEQYRLALGGAPDFIPARFNLGQALLFLGRNDEALDEFEQVLKLVEQMEPSSRRTELLATTHRGLADALVRRGRYDQALTHVQEALRANPNLAGAYMLRGEIASARGRPAQARRDFEKALILDPQDQRPRKLLEALTASGALRQAPTEQGGGETPQQLIDRLTERLRQEPDNADLHDALGALLAGAGQYDRALAALEEALRLSPTHLRAHLNLAAVYQGRGEHDRAERYYRLAVHVDPASADARWALVRFLSAGGKPAEAVEAARDGLEHLPDNPLLLRALAWLLATCPDDQLRNGHEALSSALRLKGLWEQAGSRPQRGTRVLDVLAAAYAELGRFEDAVAAAEQALSLAGDTGQGKLAEQIAARLALYRQGRPCREVPIHPLRDPAGTGPE